ncbi:MAG: HNH endonuclease [Candidatus Thiodiazotropha sp.]
MADRNRIDKIAKEKILDELRRVAAHYGMREFSGREFDDVANGCSKSTASRAFGSWKNALEATGLELTEHRNSRKDKISEPDLILELKRVWALLGHRPSRTEWEGIETKYSYGTYKRRFGGWENACAIAQSGSLESTDFENDKEISVSNSETSPKIRDETKRNIPLKLRLKVFKRDSYKCVLCGRSPATEHGVVLHVDHIIPFSEGGETSEENLQTLCQECNLGKSNQLPEGVV